MNILAQKDIDRFWGKVNKEISYTFYNNERCWIWTAGHFDNGYGAFWIVNGNHQTHRVSWMMTFGEIYDNLFVLHHCDNRSCVHPNHLFLGTHQDNMDDMTSKGRANTTCGESKWNSKLTLIQVAEIRKRYGFRGIGGETSVRLAEEFGISVSQISEIVNNKSWVKK